MTCYHIVKPDIYDSSIWHLPHHNGVVARLNPLHKPAVLGKQGCLFAACPLASPPMTHQIFRTVIFAFTLMLPATFATAYDLSAKPVGDVVHWHTDNGNTTVEVLARDGKLFKLAFTRDNSKGQPDFAILWARKDGQVVEHTDSSGEWRRFKPHNCELTLGKCRYTERHSGGLKRKMIHLASGTGGRISYALYHTKVSPANLVEKGSFTVDQFGYVIDRDYVGANGKPRWSRRISK